MQRARAYEFRNRPKFVVEGCEMLTEATVTRAGQITGMGDSVLMSVAAVAKRRILIDCVYLKAHQNEPLSLQIEGKEICGTTKANENSTIVGRGFVLSPGEELKIVKTSTMGGTAVYCVTLTPVGRLIGSGHD